MEKKRNQSNHNSLKEPSNKISSTLRHLLFRHKLPRDFPLEQQIKEFNAFWNKDRGVPLNLDERLQTFAKERNWTNDDRKNFRIMSAIKDGWRQIFGRIAKDHLIAQKDGQGADWVCKYECRNCGSVDKRGIKRALSQYQYDQLTESEELQTLLGQREKKMCPNCGEYTQFKKVRARTQSWEMEKHLRKIERIQERKSNGILLSPEQLKEISDVFDAWNNNIAKRYEKITINMFRKGIDETISALNQLWRDAKPYMERFSKPFGIRLCARGDCFRFLPQGSRSSRKYCSEQCKATQKSRNARRR